MDDGEERPECFLLHRLTLRVSGRRWSLRLENETGEETRWWRFLLFFFCISFVFSFRFGYLGAFWVLHIDLYMLTRQTGATLRGPTLLMRQLHLLLPAILIY